VSGLTIPRHGRSEKVDQYIYIGGKKAQGPICYGFRRYREGWVGTNCDGVPLVGKIGAGLSTMTRLFWFGRGSRPFDTDVRDNPRPPHEMITMATKKTSIFTLTERITLTAVNTDTFATIDLGSYVDIGDRQSLQVHSVDFIFQGADANDSILGSLGNGQTIVQVTDLNRGGMVFSDDRALVASGVLTHDNDGYLSMATDLYPDNFGKGSDDGRYVVNDQLYITANLAQAAFSADVNVTVRVNASIVSLTAKDFMAIAIQSTAADN
jgi:hypothetical protein